MKNQSQMKFVYRLTFASLIVSLSGCAVILAPSYGQTPDLSKITAGASRADVEQELGEPIYDKKVHFTSTAYKRSLYHYYARTPLQPNPSQARTFASKFTGFRKIEVLVHYDRGDRVTAVSYPMGKLEEPTSLKK